MNQTFNELKLEQHPDKTLIGRVERGFDFLGYHFKSGKLYVAGYSIERFKKRIARLYEQGADIIHIGEYVRRWWRWVWSGVSLGMPNKFIDIRLSGELITLWPCR